MTSHTPPHRILASAAALLLAVGAPAAAAEPAAAIQLPPGFRAELVYAVPPGQGSWVSLAVDGRGRILASDQHGGLYRLEPAPLRAEASQTRVQPIPLAIGMAQGMACVGDALYIVMNGRTGAFSSGLYRLTDTDGDDEYDRLEQLRVFLGEGEHGPHAVVPGPDGQSLYVVCGNHTAPPLFSRSLLVPRWGEDQLLPRLQDPMLQTVMLQAPGGWVARTDLDGKNLELFSVGLRNAYAMAFNADGELFTFDSDMEWDIGTPWYRPTRVCHLTSGSEWGWRGGDGIWPEYYLDTLPGVVDVGPGSPTGAAFGYETHFPEPYRHALFVGDWSYGNIYAIHLSPQGASYRGRVERFASATPLAVTALVVRPQDGALYFAVGGRQSASAVYRIVAADDAAPPVSDEPAANDLAAAEARARRRRLEQYHGPHPDAVDAVWPHLDDADRFVRYAARVALEHQAIDAWLPRALAEPRAEARVAALAAAARVAAPDFALPWAEALAGVSMAQASREQRLAIVRTAALGVIRFDPLPESARQTLLASLDATFPTGDRLVDRELGRLLVRLRAPAMPQRLLALLDDAASPEEQIDAAVVLSAATADWSLDERRRLLDWFDGFAAQHGSRSYFAYLQAARDRWAASLSAAERTALGERVDRPLATGAAAPPARPLVHRWTLDEAVAAVEADAGPRDLMRGRRMFAAAACYNCHRLAGEGSAVGPDLTGVGRRFGVRDILQAIIEPDHEVSDQYRPTVFEAGGRTIVGRVTNLNEDSILVSTDMLDPKKEIRIRRDEITAQRPATVSLMPAGLVDTLDEGELLDLVAFLRAGGAEAPPELRAAPTAAP